MNKLTIHGLVHLTTIVIQLKNRHTTQPLYILLKKLVKFYFISHMRHLAVVQRGLHLIWQSYGNTLYLEYFLPYDLFQKIFSEPLTFPLIHHMAIGRAGTILVQVDVYVWQEHAQCREYWSLCGLASTYVPPSTRQKMSRSNQITYYNIE